MNHQQFKEWLQLSMYDELTAAEKATLDEHLSHCSECQIELEELQKLHETLAEAGSVVVDETVLNDARRKLRASLHVTRTDPSLWDRLSDLLSGVFLPNYRIALGGMTMLVAGVFAGRLLFPVSQNVVAQPVPEKKSSSSAEAEPRISNIRFVDPDASDGEIEFTFDATSQVRVKGSINDEHVQKVLAHALVNDQNPGVRLRSVSAFSTQARQLQEPDVDVKAALILAAKTDNNPAVRMEALKTLRSFFFDGAIKQTYLHVLMRDANPALRIAAINSLDSARTQSVDSELLNVLQQRMKSDDNSYVRIRAKAVLEEIKQQ